MFGQPFRHQALFNAITTFCLFSFLSLPAYASDFTLVPYRAVYDVELDNSAASNTIVGITGRMVYEFKGSECLGFTALSRSIMKTTGRDVSEQVVDKQVETYETPRNNSFTFKIKTYTDGKLTTEIQGSAKKAAQSIDVNLQKPNQEKYHLNAGHFISVEAQKIINEALKHHHIYNFTVYDPTIDAKKIIDGAAFIGDLTEPAVKKPIKKGSQTDLDTLLSMTFWPVTISYFDDKAHPDGLPIFSMSFHLYRNGVISDIRMDSGEVSIRSELKAIEFLKQHASALSCLDKK